MKFLKKYWAIFVLTLLVSVLIYFNFDANTFLSGWDNLHPEFNPLVNLERAWQASWQEYQGLGLLGGMAHAADLFRQILLLPVNLFLPVGLARYFWHFLMLFVGVFGAYKLILFFVYDWQKKDKNLVQRQLVAFLGASFYLLNFATVQNFYTSFEPFASFFGFLPWLLLLLMESLEASLKNQNSLFRKKIIYFFLISILASSIAYVQTIFVVYVFLVFFILVNYLFKSFKRSAKQGKKLVKTTFLITVLIFAANAFWFLPASYFTFTGSELLEFSKSKAMSNDELFLRNQANAKFTDIARMRGFWLEHNDFDNSGNAIYLMDVWKEQFSNPLVNILSWGFFLIVLLAIFDLLRGKNRYKYLLLALFLLSFFMISAGNFPFAHLTKVLHVAIPLFYEMFRIAFTKWVIPFSLFYSILLAFGFNLFISLLKKIIGKLFLFLIFLIAIIFYSFPSFQGNYFYKNLRLKIPDAYFQVFDYFENEVAESSRIANFPQHSFHGWQWNDWGYRGSGFLWYGIKQPILDRAFDVWSEADERYYWQLQYALDKKDISFLENVLRQYDVDYLLLDQSILNRKTNEPFIHESWIEFFKQSELISLEKEFDFILLYSFRDDENSREKEFISFYNDLPKLNNNYSYSYYDQGFIDYQDYLNQEEAGIRYPFPSLFSNHSQAELEFLIEEKDDSFYLYPKNNLEQNSREKINLSYLDYLEKEKYLPVKISWQTNNGQSQFIIESKLPEISFGDENYSWEIKKTIGLNSSICQQNEDCFLVINNQIVDNFTPEGDLEELFFAQKNNLISFARKNKIDYYDYSNLDFSFFELKQKVKILNETVAFQIKVPKLTNKTLGNNVLNTEINRDQARNCDSFLNDSFTKEIKEGINSYQSQGAKSCDSFFLADLDHQQSYLFKINSANKSSLSLLFAVQSPSLARSPIETFLSKTEAWQDNYLILPATEDFNSGYNLYFSTDSYGGEINQNLLSNLTAYYFPSNFIRGLKLLSLDQKLPSSTISNCNFTISKKSLWFYQLILDKESCVSEENLSLKLSQAYGRDWLAFTENGTLDHQKFNNWANAWELKLADFEGEEIIITIFFWPQLLEYLGFALAFFFSTYLIFLDKK